MHYIQDVRVTRTDQNGCAMALSIDVSNGRSMDIDLDSPDGLKEIAVVCKMADLYALNDTADLIGCRIS